MTTQMDKANIKTAEENSGLNNYEKMMEKKYFPELIECNSSTLLCIEEKELDEMIEESKGIGNGMASTYKVGEKVQKTYK